MADEPTPEAELCGAILSEIGDLTGALWCQLYDPDTGEPTGLTRPTMVARALLDTYDQLTTALDHEGVFEQPMLDTFNRLRERGQILGLLRK
jgi:hypothetical protein